MCISDVNALCGILAQRDGGDIIASLKFKCISMFDKNFFVFRCRGDMHGLHVSSTVAASVLANISLQKYMFASIEN